MNVTGPASTSKNLHSPLTVFSSGYAVLPDLARDTVSMDTPMASATSFNVSSRPNSSSLAFHKSNSVLRIATLKTSNCVMVEPVKFSLDKNSKVWYLILTHTFDGTNQIQQSSPNRETKNPAQSHQQCGTVGNEPGFVFLNAPPVSGHSRTGLTKQKAKVSEMANTIVSQPPVDSQTFQPEQLIKNGVYLAGDNYFVIIGDEIVNEATHYGTACFMFSEACRVHRDHTQRNLANRAISWNVAGQQRKLVMV